MQRVRSAVSTRPRKAVAVLVVAALAGFAYKKFGGSES
jgi:hypothetical protein